MVHNSVSGATVQRFRRLLGPRECGFATAQQLQAELRSASEEENNKAITNGDGAYLIGPRAAVEALIFYLRRQYQFVERGLRGADGRAVADILPFVGQTNASSLQLIRTYARTHIRTCAHTHVRTYAQTHVRTYTHTHIRTYVRKYKRSSH